MSVGEVVSVPRIGRPYDDRVLSLAEWAARLDVEPERELFRGAWGATEHGVIGADQNVGKSWLVAEAMVAAGGGGAWLGQYPCDNPGPVLVYASEGGARKALQRARVVAAHRGIAFADLAEMVHLSDLAPQLRAREQVLAMEDRVASIRPVLTILDPLYLSIGGAADGRSLFGMGDVLATLQAMTAGVGSALMVTHHNNRDGRLSGAGPAEWGRVLINLEELPAVGRPEPHSKRLMLTFTGDSLDGHREVYRRVITPDPDRPRVPKSYRMAREAPDPGAHEVNVDVGQRIAQLVADARFHTPVKGSALVDALKPRTRDVVDKVAKGLTDDPATLIQRRREGGGPWLYWTEPEGS